MLHSLATVVRRRSELPLLLADPGQPQRPAELLVIAWCHLFVVNSRWFEGLARRHLSDSTVLFFHL